MNIYQEAERQIKPFLEMSGYEPITTFYLDFTIADAFGVSAVKDTYNRAFNDWKNNAEYITELCLILNWKIYQHYKTNKKIAELYDQLWKKTDAWCMSNLKNEDLEYYIRVTD